jgi:hypothetical protein
MSLSRFLIAALFFAAYTFAATPNQPVEPRITLEVDDGFCPNGSNIPLVPSADDPPQLNIFGDFCHAPYKPTGLAITSSFRAPKFLRIYAIGFAKSPMFLIERISDGTRFRLVPFDETPLRWSRCDYTLPADWQGKEVRIVAEGAPPDGLWRAFSEPMKANGVAPIGDAIYLLALTVLHYAALMLCALAITVFAILRGVRDRIQAGLITLAATAVPGYFVFWLTLWTPHLNRFYAMGSIIAALIGLFLCLPKLTKEGWAVLRSLLTPLLLTGAAALMVLSSGFLYGGMNDPLSKAQCRFLPRLPPDNELPLLLALGTRSPHVAVPMQGNWLSSDRPPLESGMVLAQFPLFRHPRDQGYTVLCVLAQTLWIFALWLLLSAFRLDSSAIVLSITACLFSGFAFLNSFFVWPKMLAGAYALGFFASFVSARLVKSNSRLLAWLVPGSLLAFSLLAHGGTVFALLPAVPLLVFWKRPWPIKRMMMAVVFGFLVYSPWILYQKLYDPPGDRLLKYHLAGVEPVTSRPFFQVVKTAYGSLSWDQIVSYKKQNLQFAFGGGWQNLEDISHLVKPLLTPGNLPDAAPWGFHLREQMFFHPAACLGFFLLSPLALLAGISKRFRTPEWRAACAFWVFAFIANGIWCLLMFGPSTTSIHQGAYATMLLAMAAAVLSLWALWPPLAVIVTLLQVALNFLLNELLIRIPYPNGLMPQGWLHIDTLALLCLSVVVVLRSLYQLAQEKRATLLPEAPVSVQ